MGMSASQARLLSITAKLTNNEFRAQTITNSKLRLASESEVASAEYMDALESKQLMYMSYDGEGEAVKVDMTPALIYEYSPLKNQYALKNTSGQVLVSALDAKNFEESKDLMEFLQKYDLTGDVSDSINTSKQAEYKKQCAYIDQLNAQRLADYNAEENRKYQEDLAAYTQAENAFASRKSDCTFEWENYENKKYNSSYKELLEYEKTYDKWVTEHTTWSTIKDKHLYENFVNAIGTSKTINEKSDYNGPWACYKYAMDDPDDVKCYLHLLNHILDYNGTITERTYTTTSGIRFTTKVNNAGAMGGPVNSNSAVKTNLINISTALNDSSLYIYCDGADTYVPAYNSASHNDERSGNIIQEAYAAGRTPTEFQKLISDYKCEPDEDGNYTKLKTLKEKAIDLYYLIQRYSFYGEFSGENGFGSYPAIKERLINFTEGDMQALGDNEPVKPTEPSFNETEPKKPEYDNPPEKIPYPDEPNKDDSLLFLSDQDKSQWYTNLFFMMNGSDTANLVKRMNFEGNEDLYNSLYKYISEKDKANYAFVVDNVNKNANGKNYAIFENNLYTDSNWLQFALEHGVISMDRAQYADPSEDSGKTSQVYADAITWKSIPYTNATDIITVDDEKAIAMAEVKYKKTTTEIKNKDKKYDQDLKRLDSEHNALQTEYESLKEVIQRNTDRSFKTFS